VSDRHAFYVEEHGMRRGSRVDPCVMVIFGAGGDLTRQLFARTDWIDKAWQIVDPIVERWASERPATVANYAAGSSGPAEADHMMRRDGRRWRACELGGQPQEFGLAWTAQRRRGRRLGSHRDAIVLARNRQDCDGPWVRI
jgi:hypothetical protein